MQSALLTQIPQPVLAILAIRNNHQQRTLITPSLAAQTYSCTTGHRSQETWRRLARLLVLTPTQP
jgi:hypothetical protein